MYQDGSREGDLLLWPSVDLGMDFADIWSAGYAGDLHAYMLHPELLSHQHQLYLFANPAWGDDGENELVLEATVDTLRNDDSFAVLNVVRPAARARLAIEPLLGLRVHGSVEAAYRWFYDDTPSDSVDTWLGTGLAWTLPTRSTLSPRLRYGLRWYPRPAAARDPLDQQLEAGVHLGQGLWDSAGLQLDYSYRWAIGPSGLLTRKLSESQFSFLGDEFFYSGHRGGAVFKLLLPLDGVLELAVDVEERAYDGWVALDAAGASTGQDRHDLRLTPRASLGLGWAPDDEASPWIPALDGRVEYAYTRQWSNSAWYDTDLHLVWLRGSVVW
ncbi:MAG: hypothetical protein ABIJ09_07955 [Pseudomonadota bacterium]